MRSINMLILLLCGIFLSPISAQECGNRDNFTRLPIVVQDAVMDYICDEVQVHIDQGGIAHGPLFLEWHRDYLAGLDAYLLAQGYTDYVPFPMWDPCTIIPRGTMETCDPYLPMNSSLEGTGIDCSNFALDAGKFRDCSDFCNYSSFTDFQTQLQTAHNSVHNDIGGVFSTRSSPAVLLFWAWHAYVDDLYLRYQAANLDASLDLEVEIVDHDCCEITARVSKLCCLTDVVWHIPQAGGMVTSSWSDEDYFYLMGTLTNNGTYTIEADVSSTCGNTKTYSTQVVNQTYIPSFSSLPPTSLQYICLDGEEDYCYDFSTFNCLETLEVTTSSPKLIAAINGTELCLSYVWWNQYTGSITVTPKSSCGDGTPVTWTIYANHPNHCDDDPWGPFRSGEVFSLQASPGVDQLLVTPRDWGEAKKYSAELIDLNGRVLQRQQGQDFVFEVADYAAGLYFVRVLDEAKKLVFTQKYFHQ